MFEKIILLEKKPSRAGPMTAAVTLEIVIIMTLITAPMFFKTKDLNESIIIEQVLLHPQLPSSTNKNTNSPKTSSSPKNKMGAKKPETKLADTPPEEIFQSPPTIPTDIVIEGNAGNESGGENKGGVNGAEGGTGKGEGEPCNPPNCVPEGTGKPKEKEKEVSPPDSSKVGGNVKQAKLIHRVEPVYPPLARKNGVHGDVILEAIIGIDGATHDIKVKSGHILLRQSAVDAVEQWKYEPATLNGKPIESTATVTVKYILKQ